MSFLSKSKLKAIAMPLFRLIASLGFLAIGWLLSTLILGFFDIEARITDQVVSFAVMYSAAVPAVLLAYYAYVKLIERRSVSELGLRGSLSEFGFGYLIGFMLMSLSVVVAYLLGVLRFTGDGTTEYLLATFCLTIGIGVVEEVLFRGILFRIAEEALGSWVAIVLSAAFFGISHLTNENATVFTSVAISLEAGLLLAVAYMVTKRLWLVIGIHAAWNFTQGGIFGVPVSGFEFQGLLTTEMSGPKLLSGGEFGLEGSLIALIICTCLGIVFLREAARKGRFVPLPWNREAISPPQSDVLTGEVESGTKSD